MTREWEPGDVAIVEYSGLKQIGLVRPRLTANKLLEFAYPDGGYDMVAHVSHGARPLLTIDPEDRDTFRALVDALFMSDFAPMDGATVQMEKMQAALRSLVAPPKPDVYEHLVVSERHVGSDAVVTGLCGKVWQIEPRSKVNVLGRCPECDEMTKARWVA